MLAQLENCDTHFPPEKKGLSAFIHTNSMSESNSSPSPSPTPTPTAGATTTTTTFTTDIPVDPDLTLGVPPNGQRVCVKNAPLRQADIVSKAAEPYQEVRQCYSFSLPKSGKPLVCGMRFSTAGNVATLTFVFHHHGDDQLAAEDSSEGRGRRVVYKRFHVPVFAFVRAGLNPDDTILTLRTLNGSDDLIKTVLELAQLDGRARGASEAAKALGAERLEGDALVVQKIQPSISELEEKQRKTYEAEQVQVALQEYRAEKERQQALRRLKPVYDPLPDIAGSNAQMEVYLGADETMIDAPVAEDQEIAQNGATEAEEEAAIAAATLSRLGGGAVTAQAVRSEEGAAAFRNDKVHEKLVTYALQVSKHFSAFIISPGALLGAASVGVPQHDSTRYRPAPVLFALTDVQHKFTYDFERVQKEGGVICQCYPLCNPQEGEELWVHNFLTGEFYPIQNPLNFSLLVHVASRDGEEFALHRSKLMFNESTPLTIHNVNVAIDQFIAATRSSSYSSLASAASSKKVVAQSKPQSDESSQSSISSLKSNSSKAKQPQPQPQPPSKSRLPERISSSVVSHGSSSSKSLGALKTDLANAKILTNTFGGGASPKSRVINDDQTDDDDDFRDSSAANDETTVTDFNDDEDEEDDGGRGSLFAH